MSNGFALHRRPGASWARKGRKPSRGLKYTTGKVFVGMPFSDAPEKSRVFQAVARACAKLKLSAHRVDELPGSGLILVQIFEAIEAGEFLIFDVSKEKPNVYYELGYAHGVGNGPEQVLLIAKRGTKLHFDILPLRVLFYASAPDLEKRLSSELKNLIRVSRGRAPNRRLKATRQKQAAASLAARRRAP